MKRFQLFSLASAMLLASAAGFTSCSSDSEDPLAGGSGVAGQVVKTQFYLNIPYAGNDEGGNARVSTRMTANNTQKNNNFLGLVEMEMFAFEGEPGTKTNTSTRTIRIGDNTGTNDNDAKRRLYSDIAIPVGTTHMVLYTRASKKSTTSTGTKYEYQAGSLTNPYNTFTDEAKPTLSEFKFNLATISANDFDSEGRQILSKLNKIARTSAKVGETTIEWSNIDAANIGTAEERTILKNLYENFVKLTAGSENSVIRAIEDLKAAVGTQMLADFNELTKVIKDNCTTPDLNTGFPRNLGLPDGAAVLTFDKPNRTFSYKEVTAGVPTGGNLVDHKTITYPSELAYFVSSPVKTSATLSELNQLPDYNAWLGNTADWNSYEEVVKSNTKLVVLKEPVQYGVACLESKIKCESASLKDNANAILGSNTADNTLTVPTDGITVTGILIGGQPQGVEWNFEPASDAKFDHTIYDQDMNSSRIAAKTSYSTPNYTLVLDNKDSSPTTTGQSKVYVTVELENNMGDFYGAEGLIPKGSRFYLVGQLDPNATTATKPSGETIDRVFVKDHTTVANFKITNLKKAYNHIPDMRTSKINVGLAVDLKWESGIIFNVDL